MTRYEKISSVLGMLGFVVGVIALVVSVWGHVRTNELHNERMRFDDQQRRSKLVLQIGRDRNQKNIKFSRHEMPLGYSAVYKQQYKVILNNIGFQPASIINWRVVGKTPMVSEETGEYMYGWYKEMGPWFYAADGTEIVLPFTVEPNNPRKIVIEVGVRVPSAAWNAVSQDLSFDKEYDYYKAESAFLERGYPQFGQCTPNQVSKPPGVTVVSYGPGLYYQEFILYLIKGDAVQVKATFSSGISDSYVQGENSGTSWEKWSSCPTTPSKPTPVPRAVYGKR